MQMRTRLLALAITLTACATDPDSVCQDIGYCRTLSDDQVQTCQSQAKELLREAWASGCSGQYAAYFSCASSQYDCRGNVPSFAGCEAARAALDSCLAMGRSHNACGELATRLAACPAGTGGADPSAPPSPCGASEVCAASCYLRSVKDVCRPEPAEITDAARCAGACP